MGKLVPAKRASILCVALVLGACAQAPVAPVAGWQAQFESMVRQPIEDGFRNVSFAILTGRTASPITATAGIARADTGEAMTPTHQVMIASVTKTMVAARVLQLAESGRFSLDDTLASLGVLPPDLIEDLHRIEGRSYGGQITIRQLLNHTSGLRDYIVDDRATLGTTKGAAPRSLAGVWQAQLPAFLAGESHPDCPPEGACELELYPAKTWRPWDEAAYRANPKNRDAGLLNWFLAETAGAAIAPPGEVGRYGDTNYLLLGILIETLTGHSLGAELKSAIFEPLGMKDSFLGPVPDLSNSEKRLSDWYLDDLPMVTLGTNLSFDWGGGGVVSTPTDLTRFISGLMRGELFAKASTLDQLKDRHPLIVEGGVLLRGYGLGIQFQQTDLGPRWGHTGAWGVSMYYFPEHDFSIAGSVNDFLRNIKVEPLTMDIARAFVSRAGSGTHPGL